MQDMKKELKSEIEDVKGAVGYIGKKVNIIEKKLDEHIKQPAHA